MDIIFMLVFLNLLTIAISERNSNINSDNQNRPRRHLPPPTVYTYIKHRYRSAKSSPSGLLITKPRILNNAPPVKIVHTGPYYVNHHIYCEPHNHGAHPIQEEVSFINTVPSHIHHFDHDVTIGDPSTSHGVDFLNIDLEQNQHLSNFDVSLPSITISDNNKFSNEIVKPLVQGTISVGTENAFNDNFKIEHHKYNENLDTIVDYLKESGDASVLEKDKPKDKTNHKGEFVNTPSLMKHPLEKDYGKSTYDTPGALDSYGHPVSDTSTPILDSYGQPISSHHSTPLVNSHKESFNNGNHFDSVDNHNFHAINYNFDNINKHLSNSEYLNNFKDSFESFGANSNFPNDIQNYFQNQFDNSIERLRRSNNEKEKNKSVVDNNNNVNKSEKNGSVKHNNHKYE